MKILSLFDGMACGALAMQAAGIEIDKYIAYEVDKYAIQTAQHNFPFIEERGDVFKADFTEYAGFDYLIGGSPCTYWSSAQTKNRETVASGMGWELFSQYVRALHEAKPRFFLYENNKSMSAAIRASITETFGFEPILINSALVSAQNRQRLYWCGIRQEDGTYRKADIKQPADRGILLKDILETSFISDSVGSNRANNIDEIEFVNYKVRKDSEIVITDRNMRCAKNDLKHSSATESIVMLPNAKSNALITAHGVKVFEKIADPVCVAQRGRYDESGNAPIYEVKDGYITVKGNKYPIKLVDGFYIIRKLTVRECMRLQTVPEWYEWPVSKSQAHKMLGNGWTVEVIAHLLRGLK